MVKNINEPINQHTVPRCYLKNFNTNRINKKKKTKYIVDVFDKLNESKECYSTNVEKICKINEFYTFSILPEEDKRYLEKLFSETIETDYGIIYPLLINESEIKLSNTQRVTLINFVISLFFRTSKSTNQFMSISEDLFKLGLNLIQPEKGITKINTITGNVYDLSTQNIKDVMNQEKNIAKESSNIIKFELALNLSRKRSNDIISITKVHPTHFLITSDNPVYFVGDFKDPNTIIKMPLNHQYILTILPKSVYPEFNHKEIFFASLDEEFSFRETSNNNLKQVKNAERFVIGKRDNIMQSLNLHLDPEVKLLIKKSKEFTNLF